jgi:hypothetical protein
MASQRRRRLRRQVLEARRRGEAHPADPYAEALGLGQEPEPVVAPVAPAPTPKAKPKPVVPKVTLKKSSKKSSK